MNVRQDRLRPAAREVWSTESIDSDAWREAACGAFPGVSIDWLDEGPRRGWLEAGGFADGRTVDIACTPCHVRRTPWPAWRGDHYVIALQHDGLARWRHAGRDMIQAPGDLMLLDPTLPVSIVYPKNFRLLICEVPREALAPMLAAPDHAIARRIPTDKGPGAVLGAYARALMSGADHCDPTTQRSLLTHLCGLIALALGPGPEAHRSRRETYRAARRQQILTYMETHLRDPRLTAARAANDLKMSRRWLHALLADSEISFATWLTRRRLEDCRALLDDPAHDHLSIAEIAFLSGFNDLSTFNRRFRARYGMTPRDARGVRAPSRKAFC